MQFPPCLRFVFVALAIAFPLHAQVILNGSFQTGTFASWQTTGGPTVNSGAGTPDPTVTQALVQSTNAGGVSAATLESFLGLSTLSSTNGGVFTPQNGQA